IHSTERSQMILACAIDHVIQSESPHRSETDHGENSGQVVFTLEAQPESPVRLTKYMVYYTSSKMTDVDEIGRRAEWTMNRVVSQGFATLLGEQEEYMDQFWRKSDVQVSRVKETRTRLSTVEMQQAIRLNLFHILQASARAEEHAVPAKGLTGQAYEG